MNVAECSKSSFNRLRAQKGMLRDCILFNEKLVETFFRIVSTSTMQFLQKQN